MQNLNKILGFFKFWEFWMEAYYELKKWYQINQILKDPEVLEHLEDCPYELRINWVGTIYTVINIDEEYQSAYETADLYFWNELEKIEKTLLRDGLSLELAPTIRDVSGNGTAFYVGFSVIRDYLRFWPIVWNIIKLFMIAEMVIVLINIFAFNNIDISHLFKYLIP